MTSRRGTCPICNIALSGEALTVCSKCHTSYHPECWSYNGRCAIFGCSPAPVEPHQKKKSQAPTAPPRPADAARKEESPPLETIVRAWKRPLASQNVGSLMAITEPSVWRQVFAGEGFMVRGTAECRLTATPETLTARTFPSEYSTQEGMSFESLPYPPFSRPVWRQKIQRIPSVEFVNLAWKDVVDIQIVLERDLEKSLLVLQLAQSLVAFGAANEDGPLAKILPPTAALLSRIPAVILGRVYFRRPPMKTLLEHFGNMVEAARRKGRAGIGNAHLERSSLQVLKRDGCKCPLCGFAFKFDGSACQHCKWKALGVQP